jgi:hypothetical protein
MRTCGGTLLVHSDGEPAACTEELEGRCCAGTDAPHLDEVTCESVLGPGGCEVCALEAWTPRLWRHAVRVGTMARSARPCRAHRRAGRVVPVSAEEVAVPDPVVLGAARRQLAC